MKGTAMRLSSLGMAWSNTACSWVSIFFTSFTSFSAAQTVPISLADQAVGEVDRHGYSTMSCQLMCRPGTSRGQTEYLQQDAIV